MSKIKQVQAKHYEYHRKPSSSEVRTKELDEQLKEIEATTKLLVKGRPCCKLGHSIHQKTIQSLKKMIEDKQGKVCRTQRRHQPM